MSEFTMCPNCDEVSEDSEWLPVELSERMEAAVGSVMECPLCGEQSALDDLVGADEMPAFAEAANEARGGLFDDLGDGE